MIDYVKKHASEDATQKDADDDMSDLSSLSDNSDDEDPFGP